MTRRRQFQPTEAQETKRAAWLSVLTARLPPMRDVCYFGAIWSGTHINSALSLMDSFEDVANRLSKARDIRAAGYHGIYSTLLSDVEEALEEGV